MVKEKKGKIGRARHFTGKGNSNVLRRLSIVPVLGVM